MQLGGTPAQLSEQAKNGVADIVWTAPGYSPGRFPRIEAFELPFVVKDASSASLALWTFYEKYAAEDFSAFKVLAFHVDGGQAVHTSGRKVSGLDDWKGLKLRTSTRLGAKALAAMGGTPVAMPPSQLTEAISKGVVDGALGAWELVGPLKLDEVTKFHIEPAKGDAYLSATVLVVLMNKQRYDSLPADLKAIVDRHSGEALTQKFGETFDAQTAYGRKLVRDHGGEISQFTPEATASMRKAVSGVEAEWIAQVAARGVDGKALAQAARDLASGKP